MCVISLGAEMLSITSSPPPQAQTYCPGPVIFTCTGTQIGRTFFWVVDNIRVVNFAFRSGDTYPVPLDVNMLDRDRVTAEVISASDDQNDLVNLMSNFSVNDVSYLNRRAIRCEDLMAQSNTLNTTTIRKLDVCIQCLAHYVAIFSQLLLLPGRCLVPSLPMEMVTMTSLFSHPQPPSPLSMLWRGIMCQ